MDFREFRSKKVWLLVPVVDEDGETTEFRIAYRPASITDEDTEWLMQLERARMIDYQGLYEQPAADPPVENRAQRRAKERAKATPPQERIKGPTYVEYLERLVVDWDLEWPDDNGELKPLPISRESFQMIDWALRAVFVTSIMMDFLDRPNRIASSSLSLATARESSPTGSTSASEPSNGVQASSPGILRAAPRLAVARSGDSG